MTQAVNISRVDYAKLVARTWSDDSFKSRLLNNPTDALAEVGVTVPEGIAVKVLQDTTEQMHLVLPAAPDDGSHKDQELERISGAMTV